MHLPFFQHSDIKPENIMIADDGRAVLCDLGLARILQSARMSSEPTMIGYEGHGGTLPYHAPELVSGDARSATYASDMYAYGAVLWCLFSGRLHAWEGADGSWPSERHIEHRVLRGVRPDMDALRSDTPLFIRVLIADCWAQQPDDRPLARDVALVTIPDDAVSIFQTLLESASRTLKALFTSLPPTVFPRLIFAQVR